MITPHLCIDHDDSLLLLRGPTGTSVKSIRSTVKTRRRLTAISLAMVFGTLSYAQQDTLMFDARTGNYVLNYVGETDEGLDTNVSVTIEPATKIVPKIEVSVINDRSSSRFIYTYTVSNEKPALQPLNRFILTCVSPDATSKGDNSQWRNVRQMEGRGSSLVYSKRWAWSGADEKSIRPGSHHGGFRLVSNSLPSLVAAYFQGRSPILSLPAGGPNQHVAVRVAELMVFPANHVLMNTVGPVLDPMNLEPAALLDSLLSYREQSVRFEWIRDLSLGTSLEKKLSNVRRQLRRGDTKAAAVILRTFVKEVKAQEGKRLTGEAFALLRFNAEHLILMLEEAK